MTIESSGRRVSSARLEAVARELLEASTLCAIATVARAGRAHVNTAYFAHRDALELVWISHPDADHSRNIAVNGSAAVAVFDSTQTWGEPDRGIQLFGSAHAAGARARAEAQRAYAQRFPEYDPTGLGYTPYVFRPRRVKLFDESILGAGTFVTASVDRGRLIWKRTDVYRAGGPA